MSAYSLHVSMSFVSILNVYYVMQLFHAHCVAVTQFLTEAGVFMHFGDTHLDLGSLYFLDPVWLSDILTLFTGIDVCIFLL